MTTKPAGGSRPVGGHPGRVVVLASGGGTNAQALIDACGNGVLHAEVVAIVTNNADAGVIARATTANIPVRVVEHRGSAPEVRREADQRLIEVIAGYRPDVVVLAGWMRILGADVGAAFSMINLHPAKPGEFAGIHSIERAFDAWTKGEIAETGVMVHHVPDEGVDVGPVIVTESVAFVDGDTLETFSNRLHAVEHRLIVEAVSLVLASSGQ